MKKYQDKKYSQINNQSTINKNKLKNKRTKIIL